MMYNKKENVTIFDRYMCVQVKNRLFRIYAWATFFFNCLKTNFPSGNQSVSHILTKNHEKNINF